jgi:hypothetical protein
MRVNSSMAPSIGCQTSLPRCAAALPAAMHAPRLIDPRGSLAPAAPLEIDDRWILFTERQRAVRVCVGCLFLRSPSRVPYRTELLPVRQKGGVRVTNSEITFIFGNHLDLIIIIPRTRVESQHQGFCGAGSNHPNGASAENSNTRVRVVTKIVRFFEESQKRQEHFA